MTGIIIGTSVIFIGIVFLCRYISDKVVDKIFEEEREYE